MSLPDLPALQYLRRDMLHFIGLCFALLGGLGLLALVYSLL